MKSREKIFLVEMKEILETMVNIEDALELNALF